MQEQTIAIYCFIDVFFLTIGRKNDIHCNISDAHILPTAFRAARYFYGNLSSAGSYMRAHHGVKMIHKSGFTRRLHGLQEQLLALFVALGQSLKELNTGSRYLIDSFPVPVCDNIRIGRSHLLQNEAYRGKKASKRRYFYGFKVQVITTEAGLPVQLYIHAGSFADVTALLDLPGNSQLYADRGYTCYELEDLFAACEQVQLRVCRKSNAKRKDEPYVAFLKNYYRKRLETTFSGITNFFFMPLRRKDLFLKLSWLYSLLHSIILSSSAQLELSSKYT